MPWKPSAFRVLLPALLAMTCNLHAGPRGSVSYAIVAESTGAGGARAASASYTSDGSMGDVVGISTVAAPPETAKHGYVGQLYEVTAVQVAGTPTTVNEGASSQLAATAVLDDATTMALLGTEVTWSMASGPVSVISTAGLATAANVYQDTPATVQGGYFGINGTLGLTVLNVGNDDLGIYANDGLPDSWQVQYFGLNNPRAAPAFDADGTGQDNLFKYTAGLNPTDPASRFVTVVAPISAQHTIAFSPRLPDRTYTLQFSTTLTSWQTLTGASIVDSGGTRTVTDTDTDVKRKFYRVVISQP